MTKKRIIGAAEQDHSEKQQNQSLRPTKLRDYVGQSDLIRRLSIALKASQQRGEAMEHVLLHGPPGLGKTTLAHIIAAEMGTRLSITSGPALTRPTDLVGTLTRLSHGDVLFIDEIHRLSPVVEEYLYPAMEDFRIDVTVDQGMHAKTITMPLKNFCLIGATTRAGLISGPMRDRFGIGHNLNFYGHDQLLQILFRAARLMDLIESETQGSLDDAITEALSTLAARSRGTPRIALRLLRRVRDYAQVEADGQLTVSVVEQTLELEGVDSRGLDALDRRYLEVIAQVYSGGPVGVEALAASMGEDAGTLEDLVEPFLLQTGLVARTRRGRQLTPQAAELMGRPDLKAALDANGSNHGHANSPGRQGEHGDTENNGLFQEPGNANTSTNDTDTSAGNTN